MLRWLKRPQWPKRWRAAGEARIERWRQKHHPPQQGSVELRNNRVYILPTNVGLGYMVLLVALLSGSINYNNSLGYSLTFLLASLFLTSMIYSYRNLTGIHWEIKPAKPVFAGELAYFPITLQNRSSLIRCTLLLRGEADAEHGYPDFAPNQQHTLTVPQPTQQRGRLRLTRASLYTEFPFGLFHTWTWIAGQAETLVYPKPEILSHHQTHRVSPQEGHHPGQGDHDFQGLKPYQPGESLKHVAWKVYARDQGLFSKHFAGQAPAQQWIDWEDTAGLETEARLSRLCRWVMLAEEQGNSYGLRLPHTTITPAHGDTHLHRCLSALALFPSERGSTT